MRIGLLAAAVALMGVACATEPAPHRYYVADRARADVPDEFDAYTTNGDFVRVHRDRRTGDLLVVSPSELHGERVALVSENGGQGGAPLVTTDVGRQRAIIREGSAGDRPY